MRKVNYFKTLLATAAIGLAFAACSDSDDVVNQGGGGTDVDAAYISVSVKQATGTRASGEDDATGSEGDINSIYVITFDDQKNILKVPKQSLYYSTTSTITNNASDALAVNGDSYYAIIVVNPNTELLSAITDLHASSTFDTFNAAIEGIDIDELTGSAGYTMISTPDDTNVTRDAGTTYYTNPFVELGTLSTDENSPSIITVKIERLASKITFKEKDNGATIADGASYAISGWVADVTNSTFYPYAPKTYFNTTHTGSFYTYNFYTKDPNFDDNTGLVYRQIQADFSFVDAADWKGTGDNEYVVENTMEADAQLYKNATRLIVKGVYAPEGYTSGEDWFYYGGKTYADFGKLKDAYELADDDSDLKLACDYMAKYLVRYFKYYYGGTAALGKTWATNNGTFSNLTTAILDEVENGGQVLNVFWEGVGTDPTGQKLIRWYQKGVCYYYYENRHDNAITGDNAFGKYGAVRNNWYTVSLNSVTQPGTPWYPIVNPDPKPVKPVDPENPDPGPEPKPKPGPEGPDPEEPIDSKIGYAAFEFEVGPWITWTHNVDF